MIRDPRQQVVMFDEMVKAGIMPWDAGMKDMNKVLEHLNPEEARKLRRKYRKVWRRNMQRQIANLEKKLAADPAGSYHIKVFQDQIAGLKVKYGAGNPKPTRTQRVTRRREVATQFVVLAMQRIAAEETANAPPAPKTKKRAPAR